MIETKFQKGRGCGEFLVNMMSAPDGKLVNADPQKLCEKYGLSKFSWGPGWCEMSMERWRHRG